METMWFITYIIEIFRVTGEANNLDWKQLLEFLSLTSTELKTRTLPGFWQQRKISKLWSDKIFPY